MERFDSFSSDEIMLTKRQVSMILASMLLFCLFVFIVGFFLGKRAVIDDFSSQVTKHALHDQIDFLLTTQSLQSAQDDDIAIIENEPQDIAVMYDDVLVKNTDIPAIIVEDKIVPTASIVAEDKNQKIGAVAPGKENKELEEKLTGKQYAQLIGFGTKKAAQAFVARLAKQDVPVILKTMISKTASGKQRTWYQAITPTYESSQQLHTQITKIKRLEHIRDKDIKIVSAK